MQPELATCRLCGTLDPQHLFDVEGYAIDQCLACGFVHVRNEPDPALLADIYANLHLKHTTYRSAAAATRENERRVELLQRLVPAGTRVLDAGCATGDFLQLAKASFEVSGVDTSAGAIAVARDRIPEISGRLWAGRIEDFGAQIGTFDAICLWDVIEHLWDPLRACRQLFDLLAPEGLLFLSTPDSGALTARLMGKRWAFMIPPEHLSLFSQATFVQMFTDVLPAEIVHHESHGKWTNVAFLIYKLDRMSGRVFPRRLMNWAARSRLGSILVYVPTGDIQYLAVRKPASPSTTRAVI